MAVIFTLDTVDIANRMDRRSNGPVQEKREKRTSWNKYVILKIPAVPSPLASIPIMESSS
ncbi:MAG: hypothetical protein CSYNP_04359 [Syntrophus sp. SKADARSKE-3]|nr:hypothetical protein [Syntrophus sp. SKADARSKE-3]